MLEMASLRAAALLRTVLTSLSLLLVLLAAIYLSLSPVVLLSIDRGSILGLIPLLDELGAWNPLVAALGILACFALNASIETSRALIRQTDPDPDPDPDASDATRSGRWTRWRRQYALTALSAGAALTSAAFLSSFGTGDALNTVANPIWPIGTHYFFNRDGPPLADPPSQSRVVKDAELDPLLYQSAFRRTAIALNMTQDELLEDAKPVADGPARVGRVMYPSVRTGGFGLSTRSLKVPTYLRGPLDAHAPGARFASLDAVVVRTNISATCRETTGDWTWKVDYHPQVTYFALERKIQGSEKRDAVVQYHRLADTVLQMATWMESSSNETDQDPKKLVETFALTLVAPVFDRHDVIVVECRYGGNDVVQTARVSGQDQPVVPGDDYRASKELGYGPLWSAASRIDGILGRPDTTEVGDGGALVRGMTAAGLDTKLRGAYTKAVNELQPAALLSDILTDTAQAYYSLMRQVLETGRLNEDRDISLGQSTLYYTASRIGRGSWFGPIILDILLSLSAWYSFKTIRFAVRSGGGADGPEARAGYRAVDDDESDDMDESDASVIPALPAPADVDEGLRHGLEEKAKGSATG